jgi:hypothetical protein
MIEKAINTPTQMRLNNCEPDAVRDDDLSRVLGTTLSCSPTAVAMGHAPFSARRVCANHTADTNSSSTKYTVDAAAP